MVWGGRYASTEMPLTYVSLGSVLDDPGAQDDIRTFDCGPEPYVRPLNEYLRNHIAERDEKARVGSTFLAYGDNGDLRAYVSLSWLRVNLTAQVKAAMGKPKVPYHNVPALFLTHLAVAQQWQGEHLVTDILAWVRGLARGTQVAARFVALHVANENVRARHVYVREGFFEAEVLERLTLYLFDLRDA